MAARTTTSAIAGWRRASIWPASPQCRSWLPSRSPASPLRASASRLKLPCPPADTCCACFGAHCLCCSTRAARRYLQGVGQVRVITVTYVLANLVNWFLNWVLIYGKFGMPALGVNGSAISTVFARITMAVALMGFAWRYERKRGHPLFRHWAAPQVARLKKLVRLGLPAGRADSARSRRVEPGHFLGRLSDARCARHAPDRAQLRQRHVHGAAWNLGRCRHQRGPRSGRGRCGAGAARRMAGARTGNKFHAARSHDVRCFSPAAHRALHARCASSRRRIRRYCGSLPHFKSSTESRSSLPALCAGWVKHTLP